MRPVAPIPVLLPTFFNGFGHDEPVDEVIEGKLVGQLLGDLVEKFFRHGFASLDCPKVRDSVEMFSRSLASVPPKPDVRIRPATFL